MKRLHLTLILALSLVATATWQGCGSLQKSTYSTISVSVPTIHTVMAAWNDYVAAGKTTVEQERIVKKALDTYRYASLAACDAAIEYSKDGLQNKYMDSVRAVTASFNNLSEIVKLFTGKN